MRDMFKSWGLLLAFTFVLVFAWGCDQAPQSSDRKQQAQQERILDEGTSRVGMPSITEFRERKLLRDILEKRDKSSFTTYTYLASDIQGKVGDKLCDSIGYPIPYATQFTNPHKMERFLLGGGWHYSIIPQADPNGLFSPSSAEGTWILCKDPNSKNVEPVYSEPKVITSPFPLK